MELVHVAVDNMMNGFLYIIKAMNMVMRIQNATITVIALCVEK